MCLSESTRGNRWHTSHTILTFGTSKKGSFFFYSLVQYVLGNALSEGKEVIITGDFNCDFLPNRTPISECKHLKALLRNLNLKQLIKEATRITQNSSTLLDLIASNIPQNIRDCGVISTSFSDHELVYCICKLNWKKAPSHIKTFRDNANYDQAKFCELS